MSVKGQNPALRMPTLEFLRRCRAGDFIPYISNVVLEEIDEAPEAVRVEIAKQIADARAIALPLPGDAELLADRFIQEEILPARRAPMVCMLLAQSRMA